jgi:hypothetical protein
MSNKNRKLNVYDKKIFQEEPYYKDNVMGFFHFLGNCNQIHLFLLIYYL